jgi:SAM-dependent methyltransferase
MDYQRAQIAEIYDLINPWAQDTDFYLCLAGPRPCSVLDLGCGTGMLSCALAERGHRVTGVDPAAAMLAVARSKPHAEQVEWVESSAQSYKAQRRFDLIVMTGHAFQILLTDADALAVLETMRGHLKERGRVAFETRNPRVDWVGEWAARVRMLPGRQLLETLEITGEDGEFISFQTSYRFAHEMLTTSSTLRFPSREHVEALSARSGLVVRDVFGDWDAGPFEATRSREIIFIAEGAAMVETSGRKTRGQLAPGSPPVSPQLGPRTSSARSQLRTPALSQRTREGRGAPSRNQSPRPLSTHSLLRTCGIFYDDHLCVIGGDGNTGLGFAGINDHRSAGKAASKQVGSA